MDDTCSQDNELRNRLRGGDEKALAELFSHHRERLWHMVAFRLDRKLQGRIDPDDILQEAYLAAVQRLGHLDADSTMSPFVWLRLIVQQTMIDVHRRHIGAQMRDAGREALAHRQDFSQATSISLAAQLVGYLTSPSQAAQRAEALARLEQALSGMEPIDQEVLALRHFEELSNSEVAEVLGIEQKAASIRYIRALRRLKDILSQIPGFVGETPQ